MNTNMKELSFNEMELVNGGEIATGVAIAAAIVGVAAGVVKVTRLVYDWVTED